MAENDIDLYGDDIDQDFAQDEYSGENVDLYDDVIATGATNNAENSDGKFEGPEGTNGTSVPTVAHTTSGRRLQLYVGNLTWWTTDQDIANAVHSIGINDFHEVKFFEHRHNGQSKGFCVISLGSDSSMRKCLELMPKKELNGQSPHVTLTTKQALSIFESQSKTRPTPANNSNSRPSHPSGGNQGSMQNFGNRMPMNQGPMRGPPMGPPGMQGGPRMQGPPGFNGPPNMQQQPPRFQGQPQWNGPPRPNGPPGPPNMGPMRTGPGGPPPGPQGPPRPGPPMFQGPPQGQPPRMPQQGPPPGPPGMRPDWNRPPMQQGFPQGPPPMQGPPRGPPPMQGPPGVGGPPQGLPQGPAPHVNPAFFPPTGGPPPMQMGPGPGPVMQQGPPHGPPHGPSMGPQQPPQHGPPHGYGPPNNMSQQPYGGPPPEHRPDIPPISEQHFFQEFEDIMSRNRTVSSSAIARAVSDAAAGEYASAIETLVTAISLIKQSKVANDDRCKILISSLQDTLRGVEDKSYSSSRRDRSRSRDRAHRRGRRERSSSRYRERSRDRERDRDRERERDRDRYYSDNYRERDRERERSRSRGERVEREREYREREPEEPRVSRPRNKSPVEAAEPAGDAPPSKSRYYEERSYRERERERERGERESGRSRDTERERDRDRERREESHRSRH
ncbi:cleavage and polyadenylation specificity factor subunit 6 isoform X3 [Dendroctonus ponderosae]|uniref:Cleavage and polyadenylation specificity factor subunit 6 n=1 Tax=Dendroctonus ponderosae TaxID=77166 RepID=A0AAR5QGB7_DENPD|nr:cleavage and polyadenylation specificity factor subunit 6 isoform X3 [Dendroctonus ponderosae]